MLPKRKDLRETAATKKAIAGRDSRRLTLAHRAKRNDRTKNPHKGHFCVAPSNGNARE
jgi:hypothetical protein